MTNLNQFFNTVSTSQNYYKEKIEYTYTDENDVEQKAHVVVGIRKEMPASMIDKLVKQEGKELATIDPFTFLSTMILFLHDNGEVETKSPAWFDDISLPVVLSLINAANKYHQKNVEVDEVKKEGKGKKAPKA